MRSSSIFAESLPFILPNRVQPGTEGGQIKPSAPNRGTGLAGSGGEYSARSTDHPPNPQQGGCLSLRQEAGDGAGGFLAPGPPAARSQPALPQGHHVCCQPRATSQSEWLWTIFTRSVPPCCLPPPQSICMRCQELPAGRARSKGFSPLQRNLTPASVFKDKNLCIKRPSDSEGTVWLIYFFLHIICLAFVETMKLFSFFIHETWPGKP